MIQALSLAWLAMLQTLPPVEAGPSATSAAPALQSGVAPARRESGHITLNCALTPERAPTDCRVVSETPAGAGFAQAALRAVRGARVDRATARAASNSDGRITFSLHFQRDH